jgi:predicted O-linked N-acetylglucosamine transferase (SPINDLY family)
MHNLQSLYDQAAQSHGRGNLAGAEELCRRILMLDARNVRAHHMLGVIRYQQGKSAEALDYLSAALAADPNAIGPLTIQATVLQALGRFPEALASYDRALALRPGNINLLNNRGNTLRDMGRPAEAVQSFDRILAAEPGNDAVLYNRGIALMDMKQHDQALASFDAALKIKPDFTAALNNRGNVLRHLERPQDALISFNRALAVEPGNVAALFNRAMALQDLKRHDEALESFNQTLALAPDNFEALSARGYLLWDRFRRHDAALRDLERAARIRPDAPYVRGDLLHLKMMGGDWNGLGPELAAIDEGVRAGRPVIRPFAYLALSSSPADLQACARIFTCDNHPALPPLWREQKRHHDRIRLGYVCGAYSEHAFAYLAAGLFEAHDRARFEVIALDAGRHDGGAMRARLEKGMDRFIDIAALSASAAAERILSEQIDILINVDGYSGNMRMGIFARRPAPLQVNWLGFPGTLGADYMDYIIADRTVIPEQDERFFDEKVVALPHSYQVNDARRAIAGAASRSEHGLPENAFVFCNFNQSYKFTPESFDSFLRLLAQVENSVLWLLEANEAFHSNLRRHAESRGIGGGRILFAPTLPVAQHLARMALADLFLDTLPYNAHTTASDALWAGLPLVTVRGTAFAGRVAASLLRAMALEELVTESRDAFETLALALARDPARLKILRDAIASRRATAPLFDTDLYCRHIEAAYERMWAIRPPQAFAIGEG